MLRLAWVLANPTIPISDGALYDLFALNLASGRGYTSGGMPSAEKAPGYPLLLAALYWLGGLSHPLAKLANVLAGVTLVGFTYLCGRALWGGSVGLLAAWIIGVGLGVAVLSWFNTSFMLPHGLLMNIFDWNVLALHTLPIPLMVFLFGMGTVAWQLLRLDPITIIERRD